MKVYTSLEDQVTQDSNGDPELQDYYTYIIFDTGDEIINAVWSDRYDCLMMIEKLPRLSVEHMMTGKHIFTDHWQKIVFKGLFENTIGEMRI